MSNEFLCIIRFNNERHCSYKECRKASKLLSIEMYVFCHLKHV